MKAGRLRHRCTLKALLRIPDGMGGYQEDWQSLRLCWAEITLPTGRTEPVAQQLQATVTAEIRARYAADLQAGRRLVCGDITYQIEAALPDNRRTAVLLLCSSVPNP